MAAAHKRANRRTKRRPPAQHIVVDKAQVTVTGLAYEKFKGWIPLFTGLAALVAIAGFAYNYWPPAARIVNEPTLQENLTKLQTDFTKKIGETKDIVIDYSNKNTAVVKKDVNDVSSKVDVLTRSLEVATVETLKDRLSRLFQQKNEKIASLSNIDSLLGQKNMDAAQRQNLVQRRAETETTIKWLENEMTSVQARLQRAEQRQ